MVDQHSHGLSRRNCGHGWEDVDPAEPEHFPRSETGRSFKKDPRPAAKHHSVTVDDIVARKRVVRRSNLRVGEGALLLLQQKPFDCGTKVIADKKHAVRY